jgi:tetratricopeptide (TPR) repeat protein
MRGRVILGVVVVLVLVGGVVAALMLSGQEPAGTPATDDLGAIQAEIDAGSFANAKEQLEAVLQRDETNAEAHFKLGLVTFNLGDYAGAEEHFRRSMALEPDRAAAVHHNLGVLAYQMGDMTTAVVEFQAALAADPNDADSRYQLGAAYLIQAFPMGAMEPEEALLNEARAEFEQALAIDPQKPEALVGLANVYMLRDDMGAAVDLLEQALEQVPEMREALFALGRAYAVMGRQAEARSTLLRFLETEPPVVWAQQAQEILASLGGE